MAEVGTKKILENDRIVVWEMVLEPGQETGIHTHNKSYMLYVIEGSSVDALDAAGNSLAVIDAESGQTAYLELVGDELIEGDIKFPATHNAKNVGNARYREILVEIK